MKKDRILFTIPNFITAGSGREMLNIIEGLDRSLFDPVICVSKSGGKLFEYIKNELHIPIFVHQYTFVLPRDMYSFLKSLLFFARLKIDLWHSWHWSSDYSEALLARLCGVPFVFTKKSMCHDNRSWKIKFALSTHIVARNTSMISTFLKPYSEKVTLIQGGVDANRFVPSSQLVQKIGNKLPLRVSCIAQYVKTKSQDVILQAASLLPQNQYDFILYGHVRNVEFFNELKNMITSLDLKHFVQVNGPTHEVAKILSESDIYILSTTKKDGHEEGCPVSLLEAMACGCICLASNVAGSNDIINHGENGFLFQPDSPEDLANALKMIRNLPEVTIKEIKMNAVQTIRNHFILDRETDDFMSLYKKLLHHNL